MDVPNYDCAERTGGAPIVRHNRGSGVFPQNIFVATCSEIDSNAIWLKK